MHRESKETRAHHAATVHRRPGCPVPGVDECPVDAGDALGDASASRRVVWSAPRFAGQRDAFSAVERNNFRAVAAIALLASDRSAVHALNLNNTSYVESRLSEANHFTRLLHTLDLLQT
jgi:hypothetical protein